MSCCFIFQKQGSFWGVCGTTACSQLLGSLVLRGGVRVMLKMDVLTLHLHPAQLETFHWKKITGFNKNTLLACETRGSQRGEIPRQRDTCACCSFRRMAQSSEALLGCQVGGSNALCHNWVGVVIILLCGIFLPPCAFLSAVCLYRGTAKAAHSYATNSTGIRGRWSEHWGWTYSTGKAFTWRMQWWDMMQRPPIVHFRAVQVHL